MLHKLDRFERLAEMNSLDDMDQKQRQECQIELKQLFRDKEIYWQSRAKTNWFLEGDANTKYFHLNASIKKKKIFILLL